MPVNSRKKEVRKWLFNGDVENATRCTSLGKGKESRNGGTGRVLLSDMPIT